MAIYHSPSGDINNLVVKTGASSVEKLPNILKDQYNRIAKRAKVWNSHEAYKTGDIVLYNDEMYRALKAIPASNTFGPVKDTVDHVETITTPITFGENTYFLLLQNLPKKANFKIRVSDNFKSVTSWEDMCELISMSSDYPIPEANTPTPIGHMYSMGRFGLDSSVMAAVTLASYESGASTHPLKSCVVWNYRFIETEIQESIDIDVAYHYGNDWMEILNYIFDDSDYTINIRDKSEENGIIILTEKDYVTTEGVIDGLQFAINDDAGVTSLDRFQNIANLIQETYESSLVTNVNWEKISYPDIFYNNLNLENVNRSVDITNLEDPKQIRTAKGSSIWDIQNDIQDFNIKINSYGTWGRVENNMTPPWDLLINKKSNKNVLSRFLIPIGTIENNTFVLNEAFQDTLGDFSATISEKINQIQNKKILGLFDFADIASSSGLFPFTLSDLINNILQYNGTVTENTKIYYSHQVFTTMAQNSLAPLEQELNGYEYCFSTYLKNQDNENNTIYLLLNFLQPDLSSSQLNLIGATYNEIKQSEISGQNIISTLKQDWKNLFFWGDSTYEVVFYEEERGNSSAIASNYKPFGFFWFNIIAGDCTTNYTYSNTMPLTVFHKWDD